MPYVPDTSTPVGPSPGWGLGWVFHIIWMLIVFGLLIWALRFVFGHV
jgi:hypothetical protein